MPVIERRVCYEYADEISKEDALKKHYGLSWVSTSITDGRQRWKFAELSHRPEPPEGRVYTPPFYPEPTQKPKKKIPYSGDDTKGNRKAWHKG